MALYLWEQCQMVFKQQGSNSPSPCGTDKVLWPPDVPSSLI